VAAQRAGALAGALAQVRSFLAGPLADTRAWNPAWRDALGAGNDPQYRVSLPTMIRLREVLDGVADLRGAAGARDETKVYLMARYSRHSEMRRYAADLAALGYDVTSRWILGDHDLRADGQADAAEWIVRWAQEDWTDLMAAGLTISFTEGAGEVAGRARGGRHVEFGAALAAGKRCLVVDHRENVFHSLPQVEYYADWAAALDALRAGGAGTGGDGDG
jgi:hypothetical protein